MGKNVLKNIDLSKSEYIAGIKRVLDKSNTSSTIILETGAGCGSEINTSLFDLHRLYNSFTQYEQKRIKICIDTCHIFAAGYVIADKQSVDILLSIIELLFGFDKIACIHLNNSKGNYMSRVDRHADISNGKISENGLKYLMKEFSKYDIPIVYETPATEQSKKEQINILKSWII